MAEKEVVWACCISENDTELDAKSVVCSTCGKYYHLACLSLEKTLYNKDTWKCPLCTTQKIYKNDSTPVRNVSMNRGSKRQAVCSPSPPTALYKKDELQSIMKEIIKEEFGEMLEKLNNTIVSTIDQKLASVTKEMQDMRDCMSFMNTLFEDLKKKQEASIETTRKLEAENSELKTMVGDLQGRLSNLEQQSRSSNIEVQCVPENKSENIYNVITQLSRVVKCEITEKDILHCTRVAKFNPSSTRPRSIIVQLATPRMRDQLLAATIKFNKVNSKEKLNSSHLGYAGPKSPVFVAEHLSPTNRALHAAARVRAKEKNYKYVWVRNGRIYVRKSDGAEVLHIKTKYGLNKII